MNPLIPKGFDARTTYFWSQLQFYRTDSLCPERLKAILSPDEQKGFVYGLAVCRTIQNLRNGKMHKLNIGTESESEWFELFAKQIIESQKYFRVKTGRTLAKKYKAYEKEGGISLLRAKYRDFLKQ